MKVESGYDVNIFFGVVVDLIGVDLVGWVCDVLLDCYCRGVEWVLEWGIIIVDIKFEFGLVGGELVLVDEVLIFDFS